MLLIRQPVDCFAISHFGNADVGFAQAPRRLVIRDPL
ncbi:hypothetical protein M446_0949 [Methylobacterium sp. 4-46]|nr:hypothetical protein M446_0949 [Methylobacterium sp. 4-46]